MKKKWKSAVGEYNFNEPDTLPVRILRQLSVEITEVKSGQINQPLADYWQKILSCQLQSYGFNVV